MTTYELIPGTPTAGPWSLEWDSDGLYILGAPGSYPTKSDPNDALVICDLTPSPEFVDNGTHSPVSLGNGYLLAAAPDLLAACEAFVAAWEKCLQLEKTDVALEMARAAIAKARGGDQ